MCGYRMAGGAWGPECLGDGVFRDRIGSDDAHRGRDLAGDMEAADGGAGGPVRGGAFTAGGKPSWWANSSFERSGERADTEGRCSDGDGEGRGEIGRASC